MRIDLKKTLLQEWRATLQTVFICVAIMLAFVIGKLASAYEIATIYNFCSWNDDYEVELDGFGIKFVPRKFNYTTNDSLPFGTTDTSVCIDCVGIGLPQ